MTRTRRLLRGASLALLLVTVPACNSLGIQGWWMVSPVKAPEGVTTTGYPGQTYGSYGAFYDYASPGQGAVEGIPFGPPATGRQR